MGVGPGYTNGRRNSSHPDPNYNDRFYSNYYNETNNKNPDPKKFKILDHHELGDLLLVKIKYIGCSNYEGNKILLYRDITFKELYRRDSIDPHFSETGVSPIARFEPTENGWNTAIKLMENL